MATRSLACLGDANNISTWSSTPYNLFHAARAEGFLTHALDLRDPHYRSRRRAFWLGSLLRFRKPRGYQWSRTSQVSTWKLVPEALRGGEIVSHMQGFPMPEDARKSGTRLSYYIDTTLKSLWESQGQFRLLPPGLASEILDRERELYQMAYRVVAMSREAARSVIEDYAVEPAKVFVVRAGANVDDAVVDTFTKTREPQPWRTGEPFTAETPAVLGFIGNDYERKGLRRLVAAAEILSRRGKQVRVSVIGNRPQDLAAHPLIDYHGWVNKRDDAQRFMSIINGFAIGCLLSSAEPLGISTLECLRMSVPVLGTDVGGIPDCVPADAGILVPADASNEAIADVLEKNVFDPQRYADLCAGASRQPPLVTWSAAVKKLKRIWVSDALPDFDDHRPRTSLRSELPRSERTCA